jgi:hypothetical protein
VVHATSREDESIAKEINAASGCLCGMPQVEDVRRSEVKEDMLKEFMSH